MFNHLPSPPARRLRQLLLAGLGCLTTFSCKKDAEAVLPLADAAAYNVTVAQATTAAENIALSAGVAAQRRHSQQKNDTQRVFQGLQRVLNLTPLPAADGKPGLYFCNYAQGGFAIIAADRHMQPVLAFAEHGALPTTNLQGTRAIPEGLASWLETTRQLVVALRQNPSEKNTTPGAPLAWATLVDKPGDLSKTFFTITGPANPAYRLAPPADPPTDPPTVQVGPLMKTTWGQGIGYNDFTPASSNQGYNYHCPTGCVATAMAQVMNYWHYPSSFDWANMPNSYGSPAIATLMRQCGDAVHMSYTENSSGADDDYIDDKLKGQYSYRSADYNSSEDPGLYQTVISNLNAAEPVILGGFTSTNWFGVPNGDGHCWVCDGYIQSYYNGNGYLQYSMNWGWDGRYNGWFSYTNWRVTWTDGSVHDYKYAKTYTLNIHP